jgi:thioredoxin 1
MSMLRHIEPQELNNCLKEAELVVLNFNSPGSDISDLTEPLFEELAEESDDSRVMVCTVDFSKARDLAAKLHVLSFPTTLVFWKGEVLERVIGVTSKAAIREKLDFVLYSYGK